MIPLLLAAQITAAPVQRTPDAWIAEDKFRHAFLSAAVVGFAHAGARGFVDSDKSMVAAALAGISAGLWKELRDARASKRDLVWDALGVTLGLLVVSRAR